MVFVVLLGKVDTGAGGVGTAPVFARLLDVKVSAPVGTRVPAIATTLVSVGVAMSYPVPGVVIMVLPPTGVVGFVVCAPVK
jgi:hypothetical protein